MEPAHAYVGRQPTMQMSRPGRTLRTSGGHASLIVPFRLKKVGSGTG